MTIYGLDQIGFVGKVMEPILSGEFTMEDKKLELRLKQLDTEETAIKNEMDSLSSVIDKNIEDSFKTFA